MTQHTSFASRILGARGSRLTTRRVGALLAAAGLLFIAAETLVPDPSARTPPPSLCIVCGDFGMLDVVLNVILFIPYGIGMRLAGLSRRRAFAIALVTTITIELLQIRIIAGRDASLGDVLTNALGALLGILLADTWRAWILPTPREARWRALLATGGWCAAMAIGAWGVRVSLPPTRYWGQWAPELLGFDPFTGTLLHATVAGVPFPEGAMGDSPRFRSSLLSDSVLVRATVIAGDPTRRVAPIVSVYDMYRTQIFLLGQSGRDLVFSIRTHAADARLRGPAIRLEDVFPPHAGDTLELAAGIIGRRLWIHASPRGGARESRERAVALGPALGWSFLLPFFHAYGSETPWLSALWVAGLLFPVGYWARRWRGGAAAAMLAVALVALGAAAVVFRAHAPGWWSWAAAVVGWSAGAALGAWTVARSRRERSDALAGAPAHDPGTLLTF